MKKMKDKIMAGGMAIIMMVMIGGVIGESWAGNPPSTTTGLPPTTDVDSLGGGKLEEIFGSMVITKDESGSISVKGTADKGFLSLFSGGIFAWMLSWINEIWQKYLSNFLLLIAVFLIIWGGMRMVISGGSEDGFAKGKKSVKWGVLFVALPAFPKLIVDLGNKVGSTLGVFKDGNFSVQKPLESEIDIEQIILGLSSVILEIIGAVAIIVIVIGASFWVFSAGNEKAIEQGKRAVEYSVIGLVVILFSYSIVRLLSLAAYGGTNGLLEGNLLEVAPYMKMAGTMIYILGPASLVAIMASGYTIMVSQDDDYMVKAKRILMWAVAGLIMALMAYAVVELILEIKVTDLI